MRKVRHRTILAQYHAVSVVKPQTQVDNGRAQTLSFHGMSVCDSPLPCIRMLAKTYTQAQTHTYELLICTYV